MKLSCDVIRDLLPLYLDGVCSKESRQAVAEHLEACGGCKKEWEKMQSSLPLERVEQNLKEAETVKRLSTRLKKSKTKSVLKSVLFTALIIAAFILVLILLFDVRIVTV